MTTELTLSVDECHEIALKMKQDFSFFRNYEIVLDSFSLLSHTKQFIKNNLEIIQNDQNLQSL